MGVRVVLGPLTVTTAMNRERVGQRAVLRQRLCELARQRDLIFGTEVARQREVRTDVQAPVGALVEVRGVPVVSGAVRS
jgi:hypothetical protein